MRHEYDRYWFPNLNGIVTPGRAGSQLSRYAGLPAGIEFPDRYLNLTYELGRTRDQEALVDNPAAPGETLAGTEWVHTQIGGSTVTVVDTGFPPYMRIATGATDTNGQQLQAIKGATGSTRTMFDIGNTMRDAFFSMTLRFSDANNNEATVKQSAFFFGFAPVDTSILAGVDDYIGFTKADGSNILKISADQTSGVPTTGASTSANVIDLNAAGLINKWFTLSFLVQGAQRTAQEGTVYAFVDYHRIPTGSVKHSATHLATLNLDTNSDCPGAASAPSIAFSTGEAVAKNLDIAKIMCAGAYRLG